MKNLKTTILFFVSFLLFPIISFAQWYPQTSGTTEDLTSIYFTDTLNGWAVGNNGTILNTDDGGENWEEQTNNTDYYLQDVFFTDPTHGWIVGSESMYWFGYGRLYRTINGGTSWEDMNFNDFPSTGIIFTDALNGWAAGYSINHTADGGETWETQFVPSGFMSARSICFIDSLNGWVSGGHVVGSTGYHYGYILHTNDGGNTWEYQFNIDDGFILESICFTDSLQGWSTGHKWGWNGIILKTNNGGNDWDSLYFNSNIGLSSIYFTDSFNGWAIGRNGSIISTTNGGYTWEADTSNTSSHLSSIFFTKNNYGWIAGEEGTILHADFSQIVGMEESDVRSSIFGIRCYPNPFTSSTTIEYELEHTRSVQITIYNHIGERLERIQQKQSSGTHQFIWNSDRFPLGIYLCVLKTNKGIQTTKMIKF